MADIELVERICPKDCVYRTRLDASTYFCNYAVIEHKARGCSIAECDKNRKGKRSVMMTTEFKFWWEISDE